MPVIGQHNDPIVILKITLRDAPYPVWRRLGIQSEATLIDLHEAIQVLFGWWDYHLWQFDLPGGSYRHDADEEVGPMDEGYDYRPASALTLKMILDQGVKAFDYTYDFGDNWSLAVSVEKAGPGASVAGRDVDCYPELLAFKGAPPPEDVGGYDGFHRFVEIMEKGGKGAKYREMLDWYGGPFNRDQIEHRAVKLGLSGLQERLQLPQFRGRF